MFLNFLQLFYCVIFTYIFQYIDAVSTIKIKHTKNLHFYECTIRLVWIQACALAGMAFHIRLQSARDRVEIAAETEIASRLWSAMSAKQRK